MSDKPVVLIVDDEKNTREGLSRALHRQYTVLLADGGERALELLEARPVDLVLSDVRMPGMDGLTLLRRAIARDPKPVVILLTAYGSVETAVQAMKHGAYDFLTKPVNLDHLDLLLRRALRSRDIEEENERLHRALDSKYGLENIIGQSAVMHQVFDTVKQVAPSRATVLIQGESGTGKELIAQALHRLSPRAQNPFIPVHCAALSANLLESELFGHERGAFTGATERRKGRFELADGGTLLLDEVGEIDPATQVKILRVLETREVERVGASQPLKVDVRLLAASNKDLKKLVEEGGFRDDLFFRLNVVRIDLPPLRERREDIPLLVHHFFGHFNQENAKELEGITAEAMEALTGYAWPGNIRELRNLVERMVVLSRGSKLTLRDIPAEVKGASRPLAAGELPAAGPISLDQAEKQLIEQALAQHGGNRTRAAEQLGISRRTLHRKLNEYGLR